MLSLEDNLLRVFGGERISKMMDRLQIDEDEPIEHVFITKAIGNAQKKWKDIILISENTFFSLTM